MAEENKESIDGVQVIPSNIKVVNFEDKLGEVKFSVQLQSYGPQALYIWIGEPSAFVLQNLNVSLPTTRDPMPTSTMLFGKPLDSIGERIAQRIAKKTQKSVFVSFNIAAHDIPMLQEYLEKRIVEHLPQIEAR